jgi:spermidine synthase
MKNSTPALFAIFFITGLTGLAYELVWIRLLVLVFGSTQFAVTTVLTTFMTGLALGSLVFGRVSERTVNPIRLYGVIEIGIGLYCLASPMIFDAMRSIYLAHFFSVDKLSAGFDPAQFALSFFGLIIPTTLMGGTLPVIVKHLTDPGGCIGRQTALAYALNTLGAVAGCLLTGLLSLYVLGVKATLYAAGAVDVAAGVALILLSAKAFSTRAKDSLAPTSEAAEAGNRGRRTMAIVLFAFALSGFCSLVYEVLWTRVLSLVIGSSVYAFTIMLATFLFGIGLGSLIFAPFIDKRRDPLLWFALLEGVIGLSSILAIALYGELPFLFHSLQAEYAERFYLFLLIQFFLCASLMIVPTLAMGAIFPLVGKLYADEARSAGRGVGNAYFINTAGAIAGSFVGGFYLMPLIGAQKAVIAMALLNALLAIMLLTQIRAGGALKIALSVLTVAVFATVANAMPEWNRPLMTLGAYANLYEESDMAEFAEGAFDEDILYYSEGINAVITVKRGGPGKSELSYQANGKMEARVSAGRPAEAWSLLGHVPLMLHSGEPRSALLVGLGSGITLGAMEKYGLESIDAVELEPAVVEAAGYFSDFHDEAPRDPRVRLHIADGRNFLFTSGKKYDVIVSAVSDPWITGVSNLFTREYFSKAAENLADDGIMALWFQNYRIRPAELKIGLGTFADVFPNVSLWFHYTDASDLIVIGSKKKLSVDWLTLERRFAGGPAAVDLARIGVNNPYDALDLFLMGDIDLRAYVKGASLNTDERPLLEFTLPKLMYMDPRKSVEVLAGLLSEASEVTPAIKTPAEWNEADRAEFYFRLGETFNRSEFRLHQAIAAYRTALSIYPAHSGAGTALKKLEAELRKRPS